MNKIRGLTAVLALAGAAAFGSIAGAQDVRTGEALGVGYSLYNPIEVNQIPFGELQDRVVFAAPPNAVLTYVTRDDEDLITAIETEDGIEEIAAFYDDLFEAQDAIEVVEQQVIRDDSATGLYRYNDVLFRWTVEPVREGVYRVVYNFEPAQAAVATPEPAAAAEPATDVAAAGVAAAPGEALAAYEAGELTFELYGPVELTGIRTGNIVQLAIPQGPNVELLEAERVDEGLRVQFITPAELDRVYGYYRDLLQRQGFEVVEDEPVEDDKLRAVFRRGTNTLVLTIEREGDERDRYDVLFNLNPEE